jgi:uncharacterized membrane protein YccF (DUF307 family)
MEIQFVPHTESCASITKINVLLFGKTAAVYSENIKNHVSTLSTQNEEILLPHNYYSIFALNF